MSYTEELNSIYKEALEDSDSENLEQKIIDDITILVSRSQSNKGIVTVLTTLLIHKHLFPQQDIRNHQAQLDGGFAGRVIDTKYVTPFMKQMGFPSMSESGWLTRTLEQAHPYTLDYPGKITPSNIKQAFLRIIHEVQVNSVSAKSVLMCFFKLLIKQRDVIDVELAKPHSLSIQMIIFYLEKHFTYKYSCPGAARLPTLAIYAAYQCMMSQVARYENKKLCEIVAHNSADSRSGRIGDIDVNNYDGTAYEGVEVKHQKDISAQMVRDSYEKFKVYNTERYYLLTTAKMNEKNLSDIESEVERISKIHGCQVIVNGVYSSLKYYLRLMKDPAEFVGKYVDLLKSDDTIKYQHKAIWNDIISGKI